MTIPVFILAGQSNAANLSSGVVDALDAQYGAGNYALIRNHNAGAPLTRERSDQLDWSDPSEMRLDLVTQTVETLSAIEDSYLGGVIWVQGEADTYFTGGASRYGATLEQLMTQFRTDVSAAFANRDVGTDDAPVAVLELSENAPQAELRVAWDTVIAQQRDAATGDNLMITLDPDTVAQNAGVSAAEMFRDGLHYSLSFRSTLGEALVESLLAANGQGGTEGEAADGTWLLTGGADDDVIQGGDQADHLSGEGGNDVLSGGGRADLLDGGQGDDVLIGGAGGDDLRGGAGIDTASYETAGGRVNLDLRFGGTLGDASSDRFTSIENVFGSEYGDYIYGDAAANLLLGSGGDDRMRGDAGNDTVFGGDGDDEVIGGSGADRLDGNDGDDTLEGGAQADWLRGQAGQDQIWGGRGGDYLSGGGGNDVLFGGEARDFIYGGQDNDQLQGEGGSDRLYGQSGNDRLTGGGETDWLYGGTGEDVFVFKFGSDKDLVRDFENNVDRIELDASLWTGTKTVQDVFDTFATRVGADVIFDFGEGDVLIIENTNFSALINDIDFI